ncbi:class I SAM-dependent methyltransferase [Parasedimentitalea psychrophila]|uniref:Class I SAM-dependent methyltransferase n=1 Tax=Parasedimentitalea psychrophila TaxID=2997337 RepID=A0A9Y2L4C1_9RHOB|nr:class I SAM-dependent methyltransferase [Parasedimentitalea psychrophila]WIY27172.1 class I SAM-dependent methyltransferase [Parasedimentitalea psychrophila]
MQQTTKFWDGIAEKYAKRPISDMAAYEYTLGRTRSYLGPEDQVLELGCGTGSTALSLADAVAQYTASDISGSMIAVGRGKAEAQNADTLNFVQAGVSEVPTGRYDAVLAFNLLHLIEDLDGALSHIHTLLKPGGLLISKSFCRPQGGASWSYRLMRLILPLAQMLGKAPYVAFMSIAELEAAMTRAGFDIIETGNYPANPPNRYLVARRR